MQSLFERDFNDIPATEMGKIIDRNIAEFAPGLNDRSFVETLTQTILEKQSVLDDVIMKAAPEWPIDKISIVDRNILRIGLYELLFTSKKEVPSRVAINEAIELAKTFGGESSGRFVNGVLGTVYREMGGPEAEPEEDRVAKKKKKPGQNKPSDFSENELKEMLIEKVAGGVVYAREGESVSLAFVHDIFGYWTLSKGHVQEGEEPEGAAVRKAKEEMGLAVESDGITLGTNEYIANDPKVGKVRRQVMYFLLKAKVKNELHVDSSGLDDARWFELDEVESLKIYDDVLPIITKAITFIYQQS